MLVSDMMEPGGRVFMKSEFAPIGDQCPCFSFTKKPVGKRLQADFRPGRDVAVYVGTTSTTVAFLCHAFDSDIARPSPGVDIAIVSI